MRKVSYNKNFAKALTIENLQQMSDQVTFSRGEKYAAHGRVSCLLEHQDILNAKVSGNIPYQTRLWIKDNEIQFSCTCPIGQEGIFCKHGVAVGLAYLNQRTDKRTETATITIDDIAMWLKSQDKEVLLKVILEQAINDERLLRQLSLKAAKNKSKKIEIAIYKNAIKDAVHIDSFVSYREVYDYISGIDEVIDSIQELLKKGYAIEVIELIEYTLNEVEDAMNHIDDSSGNVGGIFCRLQNIHFEASEKAEIDPEELAKRLFERELHSDFDTFYDAQKKYAHILGEKGRATYQKLAESEWEKIPVLRSENEVTGKYGYRFRITSIMENLAKETGDVNALVAVKKRDLSSPWNYLQIAKVYKSAGQDNLALEWAEKGAKTFPDRTDSRLQAFLIDEYLSRKQYEKAMSLAWKEFTDSPTLNGYHKLKAYSSRMGQWPLWRIKTLEYIRKNIDQAKSQNKKRSYSWSPTIDHTVLVQIFLSEGDVTAAWNEASEGGCSDSMWLELANKRKETNPEDALPIYQRNLNAIIDRKNNEAYEEAVTLLKIIEALMMRLGLRAEFEGYLNTICTTHKPKRNLIKLLKLAWP